MDQDKYGNENSASGFDYEPSEASSDVSAPGMSQKIATALENLTLNQNMKFMENFDPEKSNRERKKLTRQIHHGGKKQANLYDEKGILLDVGKDLCDCLEEDCPGCHFPCPKCRSCKCGHECRQNRKWMYDKIEVEGTDKVIKNKFR